jgi:hypothetical protein
MSILNFDGPSGRNFGKPLKVILGIGALAAVVALHRPLLQISTSILAQLNSVRAWLRQRLVLAMMR